MLFLGVDGGQSGTFALVADETGRVLGAGRAGPSNHVYGPDGRGKFVNAIRTSVSEACAEADREASFAAACLGLSGGGASREALARELIRADRMAVYDDIVVALAGATAGAPGVVTIAGTGSIAYGRNAEGRRARAGGWGYVFGDEGGAFDLTRQALRAALRFEEGWGPATALHGLLLDATGARNANDLMHRFYSTDFPRPRIAALAKLVDQAAANGDRVAQELLGAAAVQLAELTSAVRGQLFASGAPVRVAWIGGVFQSSVLRERFRMLVEMEDGTTTAPPVYGPAAGALIEAFRLDGRDVALSNVPTVEK